MAKKIGAEMAKTLKNLGITAKTEEEAHDKLVAALEKEGIEGMEDESLDALIDMADGFLNDGEADDNEETPDDSDEEMDELADEVEDEETDADDNKETPEPSDDDDEEEEEDDEEPVKEEKPIKKAAPAKKVAKTKAETPKKEKTEKKAAAKKATSSRGQKLDPKNNPEDRKVLDEIKEMFGEKYDFDYVKSNGATIKHIGKNGKRGVVLIENLTQHNNGTVTCNLYLLTMTKQTSVLDELGIEYQLCWTKAPMMKNITLEEAKEILEKVFETITGDVAKIDKRLGENRKKMEENLQKTEKKPAKSKKAEKTPEPEPSDDDDEEEEEDDEEPVKEEKPIKKAAPAKKVAKKSKK